MHQIVAPQLSCGWQHNYSTKTRQVGRANEQSNIFSYVNDLTILISWTNLSSLFTSKTPRFFIPWLKFWVSQVWPNKVTLLMKFIPAVFVISSGEKRIIFSMSSLFQILISLCLIWPTLFIYALPPLRCVHTSVKCNNLPCFDTKWKKVYFVLGFSPICHPCK